MVLVIDIASLAQALVLGFLLALAFSGLLYLGLCLLTLLERLQDGCRRIRQRWPRAFQHVYYGLMAAGSAWAIWASPVVQQKLLGN